MRIKKFILFILFIQFMHQGYANIPVNILSQENKTTGQPDYFWAVKTNLPILAATIANLETEFGFSDRYSVNLPFMYSPYTIKRNYRLQVLFLQPEFRYWIDKPLQGHFFGLQAHLGWFNVATDRNTRYQDSHNRPLLGLGLTYGYVLSLIQQWSAEFTVGGGYANIRYDSFYNIPNGAQFSKDTKKYWGITRIGISIVYRIKPWKLK